MRAAELGLDHVKEVKNIRDCLSLCAKNELQDGDDIVFTSGKPISAGERVDVYSVGWRSSQYMSSTENRLLGIACYLKQSANGDYAKPTLLRENFDNDLLLEKLKEKKKIISESRYMRAEVKPNGDIEKIWSPVFGGPMPGFDHDRLRNFNDLLEDKSGDETIVMLAGVPIKIFEFKNNWPNYSKKFEATIHEPSFWWSLYRKKVSMQLLLSQAEMWHDEPFWKSQTTTLEPLQVNEVVEKKPLFWGLAGTAVVAGVCIFAKLYSWLQST